MLSFLVKWPMSIGMAQWVETLSVGVFLMSIKVRFYELATNVYRNLPHSFDVAGKSLSETFILTSTNPQYDKRLSIDLPVQSWTSWFST